MISIIFPIHNESKELVQETIDNIKSTVHVNHEIIIVDDSSDEILSFNDVKLIRHEENKGVGQAFDTGVKYAKYDNLILMGCDMRFEDNGWAENLLKEMTEYPKSITCTACVNYKPDKPFSLSEKYYGANLLMKFRNTILEAQWIREKRSSESYKIPCILGACYGIKKEFYNHVDGWFGHRQWGTLEPYISLKVNRFGGQTRIAPYIETGHIFKLKDSNFHGVEMTNIIYNKLLVLELLFEGEEKDDLFNHIPDTILKKKALALIEKMDLSDKIKEYQKLKV